MTGQVSDGLIYKSQIFCIAGVDGMGLFEPTQHGFSPQWGTTACWRGYCCTYKVIEETLYLKELIISLSLKEKLAKQGKAKDFLGVLPSRRNTPVGHPSAIYDELNHLVEFTGSLLVANSFIKNLYVHLGFQPAYKYEEVHELIFDSGYLIQSINRSEEMAEIRQKIIPKSKFYDQWHLTWRGKDGS
ncbi:hypothetical protein [Nostoc sp. ChiSLP03a]|uniref:hypothetical protein n=1 Tax=Nostoc sp. ChiSLP03a TaxID=3075380 RepID=UPI002AD222D6|nr:hypothetical protein [Nostoc sp. ChiSLP03a]MDZ8209870.1 hypothetical protein [Nostoc sp. ChiSLP03a]